MAAVLSCDCLSHRMNADGTLTERKLHVNPRPLVLRVLEWSATLRLQALSWLPSPS